jgi:hypothetical protein
LQDDAPDAVSSKDRPGISRIVIREARHGSWHLNSLENHAVRVEVPRFFGNPVSFFDDA